MLILIGRGLEDRDKSSFRSAPERQQGHTVVADGRQSVLIHQPSTDKYIGVVR